MRVGRVRYFSEIKGYGFIDDENGREVYVHYTAINKVGPKRLPEGALVSFDLIETQRGLEASNVQICER